MNRAFWLSQRDYWRLHLSVWATVGIFLPVVAAPLFTYSSVPLKVIGVMLIVAWAGGIINALVALNRCRFALSLFTDDTPPEKKP